MNMHLCGVRIPLVCRTWRENLHARQPDVQSYHYSAGYYSPQLLLQLLASLRLGEVRRAGHQGYHGVSPRGIWELRASEGYKAVARDGPWEMRGGSSQHVPCLEAGCQGTRVLSHSRRAVVVILSLLRPDIKKSAEANLEGGDFPLDNFAKDAECRHSRNWLYLSCSCLL